MIRKLILLWLVPAAVWGTNRMPWLGNLYELEFNSSAFYQNYHQIQSPKPVRYHSNDLFLAASLAGSAETFAVELEAKGAYTRRQDPDLDHFTLTFRYPLWNDIDGAPVSVLLGGSLIKAFYNALHDPSSFHHGMFEGEIFLSIGKERACWDEWDRRVWGVIVLGLGDHGSPWVRGEVFAEKRFCLQHYLRGFIQTLWGFGEESFRSVKEFKGYGPIQHQSIDIGIGYTYEIPFWGDISAEYFRRVYSKNFPEEVNGVILRVHYPFGL